ncbi:MAG: hypothetical protein NTY38_29695 [Acidobacteria bacterium]|nr:hypothetical protein [Acidobacteriota bacterium]
MSTTEKEIDSHGLAARILRAMAMDSLDGLERELSRLEGETNRCRQADRPARAQEELELLTAIAHDMRCSWPGVDGMEAHQLLLGHLADFSRSHGDAENAANPNLNSSSSAPPSLRERAFQVVLDRS